MDPFFVSLKKLWGVEESIVTIVSAQLKPLIAQIIHSFVALPKGRKSTTDV